MAIDVSATPPDRLRGARPVSHRSARLVAHGRPAPAGSIAPAPAAAHYCLARDRARVTTARAFILPVMLCNFNFINLNLEHYSCTRLDDTAVSESLAGLYLSSSQLAAAAARAPRGGRGGATVRPRRR